MDREVSQLYVYIYSFCFRFFPHVGYYRVLRRIPCAIQWVLVGVSVSYIVVKVKLLRCVQLFVTPWTVAYHCSVCEIFQARVLEWVAIAFSRGSSQPRDWTRVSHIVGRCFTVWAWGFLTTKQGIWDLSSLIRDWTHALCTGSLEP